MVDRWNRKTVMMVSDSFIALVVVALAFLLPAVMNLEEEFEQPQAEA